MELHHQAAILKLVKVISSPCLNDISWGHNAKQVAWMDCFESLSPLFLRGLGASVVHPNGRSPDTVVLAPKLPYKKSLERAGAVKDLFEAHASRVYLFAQRLTGCPQDAEDLTQEVFVRALRHKTRLRDPKAARGWLFAIAANLWRSRLRRKGCEEAYIRYRQGVEAPLSRPPESELMTREDVVQVRAAMERLPDRQREVLYLHACEGFSLGEIAKILDISSDAAKASLSLARKRMRQQLRNTDAATLPERGGEL